MLAQRAIELRRVAPLGFVLFDLLRARLGQFLDLRNRERVLISENLGVERRVVGKDRRHLLIFEDRLPRALRLAQAAVDSLFGIDIQLLGEGLVVFSVVEVYAIYRADLYATLIDAVSAEPRDYPSHLLTPLWISDSRAAALKITITSVSSLCIRRVSAQRDRIS